MLARFKSWWRRRLPRGYAWARTGDNPTHFRQPDGELVELFGFERTLTTRQDHPIEYDGDVFGYVVPVRRRL